MPPKDLVQVTHNQFMRYLVLQKSGIINMNDLSRVHNITALPTLTLKEIQKNYRELFIHFFNNPVTDSTILQHICQSIPINDSPIIGSNPRYDQDMKLVINLTKKYEFLLDLISDSELEEFQRFCTRENL